jgi:hypothetical protein
MLPALRVCRAFCVQSVWSAAAALMRLQARRKRRSSGDIGVYAIEQNGAIPRAAPIFMTDDGLTALKSSHGPLPQLPPLVRAYDPDDD